MCFKMMLRNELSTPLTRTDISQNQSQHRNQLSKVCLKDVNQNGAKKRKRKAIIQIYTSAQFAISC